MATAERPALSAPPQNLEAEASVLGAILLSDKPLYQLVIEDALVPEDFYREQHRVIFAAMRELYDEGEPIDALTVTERLRRPASSRRPAATPAWPPSPARCPRPGTSATTRGSSRRTRCCAAC